MNFLNFSHSKDTLKKVLHDLLIWAVVINVSRELYVLIISSVEMYTDWENAIRYYLAITVQQ